MSKGVDQFEFFASEQFESVFGEDYVVGAIGTPHALSGGFEGCGGVFHGGIGVDLQMVEPVDVQTVFHENGELLSVLALDGPGL